MGAKWRWLYIGGGGDTRCQVLTVLHKEIFHHHFFSVYHVMYNTLAFVTQECLQFFLLFFAPQTPQFLSVDLQYKMYLLFDNNSVLNFEIPRAMSKTRNKKS
jgi:hypothetical protein